LAGIPAYALDGHTRLGRAVLESLLRESAQMGRLLGDVPSTKAKLAALASLLFLIEGGLCARECSDPFAQALKERARGCLTGLPCDRLPEAIGLMEELLPTIALLRARHGERLGRSM
jgi:hypothetical protein